MSMYCSKGYNQFRGKEKCRRPRLTLSVSRGTPQVSKYPLPWQLIESVPLETCLPTGALTMQVITRRTYLTEVPSLGRAGETLGKPYQVISRHEHIGLASALVLEGGRELPLGLIRLPAWPLSSPVLPPTPHGPTISHCP